MRQEIDALTKEEREISPREFRSRMTAILATRSGREILEVAATQPRWVLEMERDNLLIATYKFLDHHGDLHVYEVPIFFGTYTCAEQKSIPTLTAQETALYQIAERKVHAVESFSAEIVENVANAPRNLYSSFTMDRYLLQLRTLAKNLEKHSLQLLKNILTLIGKKRLSQQTLQAALAEFNYAVHHSIERTVSDMDIPQSTQTIAKLYEQLAQTLPNIADTD